MLLLRECNKCEHKLNDIFLLFPIFHSFYFHVFPLVFLHHILIFHFLPLCLCFPFPRLTCSRMFMLGGSRRNAALQHSPLICFTCQVAKCLMFTMVNSRIRISKERVISCRWRRVAGRNVMYVEMKWSTGTHYGRFMENSPPYEKMLFSPAAATTTFSNYASCQQKGETRRKCVQHENTSVNHKGEQGKDEEKEEKIKWKI